jgi:hypothetical protein
MNDIDLDWLRFGIKNEITTRHEMSRMVGLSYHS